MGHIWRYPKPLVDHASELVGKTPRTIRTWAAKGMNLGDDEDIRRFARHRGAPPGCLPARPEEAYSIGGERFNRWLRNWLANGTVKKPEHFTR